MTRKNRAEVPTEIAARVLFLANRTCCVCRKPKVVQIHHIDDDPTNHQPTNLAVLCLDCHRDTQLRGGFDRKLDAEQIILYRDDWNAVVARQRGRDFAAQEAELARAKKDLGVAMSLAEMYREAQAYDQLAIHYDILGNSELRDKYIELSIKTDTSDGNVTFLRGLQARPERIPRAVVERELSRLRQEENWHNRARLLQTLGRPLESATDYVRSISSSLSKQACFSAAYYLKEVAESGLIQEIFMLAFRQAREKGDLWWQMRALQELGGHDELAQLMLTHAVEIDAMNETDDPFRVSEFKRQLAIARRDENAEAEYRKRNAEALIAGSRRVPDHNSSPRSKPQPTARSRRSRRTS